MQKKKVTGVVLVYSKRAREKILSIATEFFRINGIANAIEDISPCIDELIKNSVKANYKFELILEKLEQRIKETNPDLTEEELQEKINSIIKDKPSYDETAEELTRTGEISEHVREILNEEAQYLKINNKAYEEKRSYTDDEVNNLKNLDRLEGMRKKLDQHDVRVLIKIETEGNYLYIEVTNTAPIMAQDLNRIYEKRDEFKSYKEEGREYEFFLNNLDTSESGFGLGYATIDSFLGNLGLDPYRSIQIIAASDTTVILSLPIDNFKKEDAQTAQAV